MTIAQLVLRWTTLQPGITIVLAGARSSKQAVENAEAIDISISAEELGFIKQELDKM